MIEFHLARLQTVLFSPFLGGAKAIDLATSIRDASDGLLIADPLILPLPPNAPSEFPRLVIKSIDQQWTYQLSGIRSDFVFELPPDKVGSAEFEEIARKQAQVGANIWDAIQSKFAVSGNRIGLVGLFIGAPENSVQMLKSKYLIPSDAPEPLELQLHILHRIVLDSSTTVNRWVRCIAGETQKKVGTDISLRAEIDINTLPEKEFHLTSKTVLDFTKKASDLILKTVSSIFDDNPVEKVF